MKLRLTQWVREVRIFAHNKQLESARQTDNEISTLSLHYKPKSKDLLLIAFDPNELKELGS